MDKRLLELEVENFRSLRKVSVPLGSLNVMVGPNGAGKSNLLEVFSFLADVIHTDLESALERRGGLGQLLFCGSDQDSEVLRIKVSSAWSDCGTFEEPECYELHVSKLPESLTRREIFEYQIAEGVKQTVVASGQELTVTTIDSSGASSAEKMGISRLSSAISTLPRLAQAWGGEEIATMARQLASFRAFEVRVDAARQPSRFPRARGEVLREDAANLAGFLYALSHRDGDAWQCLIDDARNVLPQLNDIDFDYPSGAGREVIVVLHERGLRRPVQLSDASYGTIRLLGLLALLYDPNPPALTCIEEIDHGLHPQALEVLVERLREASELTQFVIATHSPALADRLAPHELIVCERGDDGSSLIPAISTADIERIVEESEGSPLGELWFSGALGGDL